MKKGKKTEMFMMRLSPEDKISFKAAAKACDKRVCTWARERLLEPPPGWTAYAWSEYLWALKNCR